MSNRQLFKDHFDDPTFSDITLTLSDRSVKLHRVVLCRKSEYFTKLLTGGFQVHHSRSYEADVPTDRRYRRLAGKKLSSRKTTRP